MDLLIFFGIFVASVLRTDSLNVAGPPAQIEVNKGIENREIVTNDLTSTAVPVNPAATVHRSYLNDSRTRSDPEHPCHRPCVRGEPMTCQYDFVVEYYSVMGKACFDCPYNRSHCDFKHCIPGDGVKRTVLVVNRQMPGPRIQVCHGDTIEAKVTNRLMDASTSVHWHGILQKDSPFMDGVPFVSQCPIGPQASFLYRFVADTHGTHIWHAHSAFQRGDGIYGPLVVRVPDRENPHANLYDFDLPQHTFTIMDWTHTFSPEKFALHIHAAEDNKPSSLLVNGKGRFAKFQRGDTVTYTPVYTFTVSQGLRYRFRLINAGFLNCPIEMSVDGHNITIIATDGDDVRPVETESLVSLAGERYDFVLEANKGVRNYWVRFKGLLDCSPKQVFQVAMLHYDGANIEEYPEENVTYATAHRNGLQINKVNTRFGEENTLLVSQLSSAKTSQNDPALKPDPDFRFYIPYDFYPLDNTNLQYAPTYGHYKFPESQRTATPQLSHISMEFPPFPLMTDVERSRALHFCNGSSISMECRFKYCECTHVLQIPLGAVVEIILIDEGVPYDANHPFHLHGYKFRVLGMDRLGNSTTEDEVRKLDREGLLKRNFNDPPTKDTVTTPDGGYSILRFHATNPGFWIFHCHIDFHVEMGMALLFKIGDDAAYKSPPVNFPKCGDYVPTHQREPDFQANVIPSQSFVKIPGDYKEYYSVHTTSGTSNPYVNRYITLHLSFLCILAINVIYPR